VLQRPDSLEGSGFTASPSSFAFGSCLTQARPATGLYRPRLGTDCLSAGIAPRQACGITWPPSSGITAPVMNDDTGLSNSAIQRATSFGSPIRPSGTWLSSHR
jgi:hypothetical protein